MQGHPCNVDYTYIITLKNELSGDGKSKVNKKAFDKTTFIPTGTQLPNRNLDYRSRRSSLGIQNQLRNLSQSGLN